MPIEKTDKETKQPEERAKLITAEQVAKIICCSPKTVYAWAELGYIPSIKLGAGRKALLRFDSEEIHAWLRFWKEETAKKYNADAGTVAGARKGGESLWAFIRKATFIG